MVQAIVYNKEGKDVHMSKPCFGFMAYIEQWDEDEEEWDDDAEEYRSTALDEFSPHELKTLVYLPPNLHGKRKENLLAAMAGLPQFYDNVTVGVDEDDEPTITFPLEGVPMQKTIVGAMMLRNVIDYSAFSGAFDWFLEHGCEPKLAFILCQRYSKSMSVMAGLTEVFYAVSGGDESLFGDEACVCDIKMLMDGKLGDVWQGVWGSTHNGYGRDGCYDGGYAPANPRVNMRKKRLASIMELDYNEVGDSPKLYMLESESDASGRFSTETMEIHLARLKELLA